ncbi:phage major capsid protein [Mycolicibacterium septicum]|uniref:phage major capsid protein n=1 Tax=Mycolicibacterium septicum TaxID=98668 RepID=UPI00235E22F7|nr:phage major capsid protein [Mycolicibacterium septicum]
MPGTVTPSFLARLEARRENLISEAESWLRGLPTGTLAPDRAVKYRRYIADIEELTRSVSETESELARGVPYSLKGTGCDAMTYAAQWSVRVAEKMRRSMSGGQESRAVVSGSIDIPALVETEIIPIARPTRLIDLFPNRVALDGNAFEYFQQTVRTNLAAPVADNAVKPTSILTVTPHTDRARVIAHLSEPTPVRLWDDHQELQSWLTTELVQGVLDALETQVISGDGTGENFTGLLSTPGLTQVPFDTDPLTTLRSAVTALQVLGEVPTGWALNPEDAAAIDLSRWGTEGGLLVGGYESGGDPGSANIFGPTARRVVSNSIPVGQAVLGDWSKLRVYVRQDATLAIDASGVLFTKNQFVARAEGRFGIGVLRPSAFARVDLTA